MMTEFNETATQAFGTGKELGRKALDVYEQAVDGFVQAEQQAAAVGSESAIASSTCSDGARRPRSICDRYGLEMPTIVASWRSGSSASSRCCRMMSPRVGGVRSRSVTP